MTPHTARTFDRWQQAAAATGLATAAVTGTALIGWATGNEDLTRIVPGLPRMVPWTAVGLLACAVGLGLLALRPPRRASVLPVTGVGVATAASGAAAVVIGVVVLVEYLADVGQGVDLALFGSAIARAFGPDSDVAGRPAPETAAAMVLLGSAVVSLALVPSRRRRLVAVETGALVLAGAAALTALLGYVYNGIAITGVSVDTGIAVPTAVTVLLLNIGLVTIRNDRLLTRLFFGRGRGSTIARRLIPLFTLLPFSIGLLGRVRVESGGSTAAHVVEATTFASVVILLVVVASAARGLNNSDAVRRTLERQLRDERDYVERMLESLHSGVVVFDLHLRILRVNTYFSEMIGLARTDVEGHHPPYPWWTEPQQVDAHQLLGDNDAATIQTDLRRPDGTEFATLVAIRRLSSHEEPEPLFIASLLDIDDRVQAQRALAEQAEELRDRNAELADANQLKADLMAMLSHEIGQPQAAVLGYSELLEEDLAGADSDPAISTAYAAKITTAATALDDLVKDLLMMFKLEARRITARPEDVNLRSVVAEALAPLAAPVDVQVPDRLTVRADPAQLKRVCSNLVHNAAKYGEPPITVSGTVDDGQVSLTVADCGDGVPAEFVPNLFDRFSRASSGTATRKPGTGLGLFIVRELAHANGGEVSYRPARPHGSAFTITVPAALSEPSSRVPLA